MRDAERREDRGAAERERGMKRLRRHNTQHDQRWNKARDRDRARGTEGARDRKRDREGEERGERCRERRGMDIGNGTKINADKIADKIADKMLTKDAANRTPNKEQQMQTRQRAAPPAMGT